LQVMARIEAAARGADEALLLNTNGEVAEAASANLFWVYHDKICTVPTGRGVLPGITRAVVLEICQGLGVQTTMATIMVLPVLIYWLWLDVALGMEIAAAAVLLLLIAATIVNHVSITGVLIISAMFMVIGFSFQVIGHQYFERRKPSLIDHPSHLLLGPIFVMAKLFIAFGFRHDLDFVLQKVPQPATLASSSSPKKR